MEVTSFLHNVNIVIVIISKKLHAYRRHQRRNVNGAVSVHWQGIT